MPPALILANAHIATGDPRRPWATALAIDEDGALAALGGAAEIQKLAGPATRVIDARGRTISLPVGTMVGQRVAVTEHEDGDVVIALLPDRV